MYDKLGRTPSLHSALAESNVEMHLKFYDTELLMRSTEDDQLMNHTQRSSGIG